MIVLGRLCLALALIFAGASVLLVLVGVRWDRKGLQRIGYYAVYGFFLTTVIASAVLLQAFLKKDFGFAYVAAHSDATLPAFYRIAGFWAGQEGSFLLWLLLLAIAVLVIALVDLNRLERLTGGAVAVLGMISAVFAALMVFDAGSDPFLEAAAGTMPFGLNPLLLHPAMVLHPPALFVGYVGLAVPFAFAISTLLLGRGDGLWIRRSQKWAVAGWLFLSLGIGLGAWWAYVVLSFGGYWGWDPVENTSLVPWLTATALLHSFTVYRSRSVLKRWALGLAIATFWFTILATWTTRTGLISSVHAFGTRDALVWILSAFLIASAALSAALMAWRWRRFEGSEEVMSLLSRDFLYHLTNLLLTLFAIAVAFATVAVPLVLQRTVGAATYDAAAKPLGVVVLALMAICPLLAWRQMEGTELSRTLLLPTVTMLLSAPLWWYLGFQSSLWGLLGLLVCGFAFGAVIQFVLRTARRAAGPGGSLWSGLGRAFTGSRTRTAAYVVHLGMVLVVAGLLGATVYKQESFGFVSTQNAGGAAGDDGGASVFVTDDGRYVLEFTGMRGLPGSQGSTRYLASFDVLENGSRRLGTVEPHTDIYPLSGAVVRAVILGRAFEDVFVVADEPFDAASDTIALRVVVFPLIRWVWIGAILLCAGAAASLWPKRRRRDKETKDVA